MERKEEEIKSRGTESLSDEELWFSASAANDLHAYDAYAAYRRFKRHTAAPRVSLNRRWRWLYGAAAVILLLVVGGVAYYQGGQGVKSGFADIVVEAPPGSSTKLTLPDGSQVWLNAGSRIAYSQGFGLTGRELPLAITEYNIGGTTDQPFQHRFSYLAGLMNAELMRLWQLPENKVIFANYWHILNGFWGAYRSDDATGKITRKQATLPFFEAWAKFRGSEIVQSEITGAPRIEAESASGLTFLQSSRHITPAPACICFSTFPALLHARGRRTRLSLSRL